MKSTILYVEDNEQNFYLVKVILTSRGHEVLWAKDGPAGIEMASRTSVDLVLLDIQLPVMNGYEVVRRLREDPKLRAMPIVALSSYAMPGDREKAIEAGCTDYIEKPIDPLKFGEQVEAFLPARACG